MKSPLAIHGGPKSVTLDPGDIFTWPILTAEDEEAVLDVLRRRAISGSDVTRESEREFAAWSGRQFALAYPNGAEAVRAAVWACGLGAGDEMICLSMTYWASATCALTVGAAVHFADCLPGTLRKGRMVGTFGRAAAMSMMSGKGFAVGEGGMLLTDDREVYERAVAYGHYERTGGATRWSAPDAQVTDEALKRFAGVPIGGYKHRINQMCSALGRTQLKYFPKRIAAIQAAMNCFWDLLEGVPGIRAHRVPPGSGSTMGPWYFPRGLYCEEELGGLPIERFCEAVRAEGFGGCLPGANEPLHLHPVFHEADLFRQGRPTVLAFGQRDVRQGRGDLPVSEAVPHTVFAVPWFKHNRPEVIQQYADAYRKVAECADRLLGEQTG